MRLVFATANAHKLEEVRAMLPPEIHLESLRDYPNIGDIDEPFESMEGNAMEKAVKAFEMTGLPAFADDSGIEVYALDMAPGARSARYAGEPRSDAANTAKLLEDMTGIADRRARFRAVIAYVDGQHSTCVEGVVEGRLSYHATGGGGFGYDPIFIPEGYEESFASLPPSVKKTISHRRRAVDAFLEKLQQWSLV